MAGLRSQIGWLVHGRANTVTTLDSLSADLRALQEKVAAMELRMREADIARSALAERQLDEFDQVRAAVATATDDLSARIAALGASR